MHYTFLGQNVCRHGFLSLSGLGCSTLQVAREAALEGKVSWSSEGERELHGFSMHAGSHNKANGRTAYHTLELGRGWSGMRTPMPSRAR